MDIETYRKQCLDEIGKAGRKSYLKSTELDASLQDRSDEESIGLVSSISLAEGDFESSLPALLSLLGDSARPTAVRLAAKSRIDAAAFTPDAFAPFNADYLQLLRRLATDSDKQIRTAALRRLAIMNDRHCRKLLRESLEGKRKNLVPKALAVSLLGLDNHGSARPMLREFAVSGKGKLREQAMRALSSDPKSATLFESVASDKQESRAVREIAALSLKLAAPSRFARMAKQVILDDDEDDGLRAAAMSAVAHTQAVRAKVAKPKFLKAVDQVGTNTKSRSLKASIKRFKNLAS